MLDKSIPFDKRQEMMLEEMYSVIKNDLQIDAVLLMDALEQHLEKSVDATTPFEFAIMTNHIGNGIAIMYLNDLLAKKFGTAVKLISKQELDAKIAQEREQLPEIIKNLMHDAERYHKLKEPIMYIEDKPKRYDKLFGNSFKSKKSRRGSWPSNKF